MTSAADVPGMIYDLIVRSVNAFYEYESSYKGQVWIDIAQAHSEIPIFAVSGYLAIVFYAPAFLEAHNVKLDLRSFVILWNAFLAVFSIIGATRTVPYLIQKFYSHGFEYTVCTDPRQWYLDGPVGLWVGLFIFSKVPELLDTVFLVIRRRPVIFLHWFHHCTVLLYCWHAFHMRIATGLWFAAMNFTVHSVMYTYYTFMAARLQHLVTKFAFLITTVQILQMAMGAYVTFISARRHWVSGEDACYVDPANYKMGLAMYSSYFVLFASLFWNKYVSGPRQKAGTGRNESREELCGVDLKNGDTTGRFNDGLNRFPTSGKAVLNQKNGKTHLKAN